MILIQIAATLGDLLVQRSLRIEYKWSTRRSLLAGTISATLAVLVVLFIVDRVAPFEFTALCFDGTKMGACCMWERDSDGVERKVCGTSYDEKPQGFVNMLPAMMKYKLLLLNGVSGVAYSVCNTLLLKHYPGQILKVNATLVSTFFIAPIAWMLMPYETERVQPISFSLVFLAIFGATLSTLSPGQFIFWKPHDISGDCNDKEDENGESANDRESVLSERMHLVNGATASEPLPRLPLKKRRRHSRAVSTTFLAASAARDSATISLSFLVMALSSAFWAAMQRWAQVSCGVNHLGFLAIDQIASAPYIFAYILLVSSYPARQFLLWESDQNETFFSSLKRSFRQSTRHKCRGFAILVVAKIFTAVYLIGQFMLLCAFDPALVVLQMSALRVVFSWSATLLTTVLFPNFLQVGSEEKKASMDPRNLTLKLVGSVMLLCVLWGVAYTK